ncbi:MAG: hypothetical protein UT84_C0030G0002 [Candidatus Curtissbacteria bacterium GW2011_GWA1_40_16]|uniref:Uncharacterized protein n=1 Tax=Candidatus Curtissbacteria bacterium GW2011_GWA1_40_16 TaxID=1618405 RepID=A0A0G0TQP1_9BACT|nr:MAG: hypothetical protein UT84_C0030G0002 [Candidatus Curtissbacteria bacterium GW2011_GWA1_40_16]
MDKPAPKADPKNQILVTDTDTFLGSEIAKSLLFAGFSVWGVGNSPLTTDLLSKKEFTLCEVDFSQPLPSYLPKFANIFFLGFLKNRNLTALGDPNFSPQIRNLLANSSEGQRIFVLLPIFADADLLKKRITANNPNRDIDFILTGDVYGPGMPLAHHNRHLASNLLADLIWQAAKGDKIILKNEGLDMIYPTFIADATFAISKLALKKSEKKVHFVISDEPMTALSASYAIQHALTMTSGKNIDLFFEGPEPVEKPQEPKAADISNLEFEPKQKLEEGLKITFADLGKRELVAVTKPQFYLGQDQHGIQKPPKTNLISSETDYGKRERTNFFKLRIFQFFPKKRFKSALVLLVVLAVLILTKTAFDIYMGISNLKSARKEALLGNFSKSHDLAKGASKYFGTAASEVKAVSYPIKFIFPQKTQGATLILNGASFGADALSEFAQGSGELAKDLKQITSKDSKAENLDFESASASFSRAHFNAARGAAFFDEAQKAGLSTSRIAKAKESFVLLGSLAKSSLEVVNLASDFTGRGQAKTYLVLFQNNTELRPGGGFIGNLGLLKFEEGDFEVNANLARDFFKKETGADVDGVIAMDLTFVQNLLKVTGPVKLSDYNEEITADNLFEKGEYYSEVNFFPGSTQKRDFFGALTRALITKILEDIAKIGEDSKASGDSHFMEVASVVKEALARKHIMMTFDDANLSAFAKAKGWNHPLPPASYDPSADLGETRDFLALLEANLGANKVNRVLGRKVDYEVNVGRDGDLVAKLTIDYTNNSQAETWPVGKYVNYLRVYVPKDAELLEYKNAVQKIEEVLMKRK